MCGLITALKGSYVRDDLSLGERFVEVGEIERVGRGTHLGGCWVVG
jgi:hypothetical protein